MIRSSILSVAIRVSRRWCKRWLVLNISHESEAERILRSKSQRRSSDLLELARVLVRFRSPCPLRRKRESRRYVIDCETPRNRLRVKFAVPEPAERQRPEAPIIPFGSPAAFAVQPPCPQTAFSGVQTATTRQQGLTTL